jgi:excisionase family DNA binding protein
METTGFLLSYRDAGEILGVDQRTVFEYVRRGELASVILGYRNKRIDPADLRQFIERRKTTVKAGAAVQTPERGAV